jgi:glycolate oxidase
VSAAGIVPAALELIDRLCLRTVAEWQGWDLPADANAMLMAKVDEPGPAGEALQRRIAELFEAAGGVDVQRAADPQEVDRLFLARRLAYPSLERLGPVLTEDVCVPRGAVPEMLGRIERIAAEEDVVIANIAHAGDGNLHPLIVAPDGDEAAAVRAKVAFDRIVEACRDLGGTVTGEHGVGLLKLAGAGAELSDVVLGLHESIKRALDPQGILNPGKAFPARGAA